MPEVGFALDLIRSAGLKGKSVRARARGMAMLVPGLIDAWRLLTRRRPDLVVGVGGYSSGPVVLVAALRGIRTMVLEQNAVPGLTNRWLARWIDVAAVAYDETLAYFRGRGFVSGNPVRPEFLGAFRDEGSLGGAPGAARARVLVLGGSQGAHAINVAMVAAAPELARRQPGFELVHQTGQRDVEWVRAAYAQAGLAARVEPFLEDAAGEMHRAAFVICRAGATTLAELAAIGRAAVVVPFPAATDDHQRLNARVLADAGAAVVIEERELAGGRLAAAIDERLGRLDETAAMGKAMRRFARPDAAARIVDRALQLAGWRGPQVDGDTRGES